MALRKGKCTNFGNCMNADRGEVVAAPDGQEFVCPQCGRQLNPVEEKKAPSSTPIAILLIVLLLIGAGSWYFLRHRSKGGGEAAPVTSSSGAPAVTSSGAEVILRLHGSNTIGAQLAPALAQAYLRQQGAQDVKTIPGAADEVSVQGTISGSPKAIEIAAHGSATAFTDLAAGKCDIGMASRQIKPGETASLSSLGDKTSPASEHVLGLDGVTVIVHRANPVSTLSNSQLGSIFSGEINDWSKVGGGSNQFKIDAR